MLRAQRNVQKFTNAVKSPKISPFKAKAVLGIDWRFSSAEDAPQDAICIRLGIGVNVEYVSLGCSAGGPHRTNDLSWEIF